MHVKETLSKKLNVTRDLLANLFILKNNIMQIRNTKAIYFEDVISKSPFFITTSNVSFRLFVIDLMKLLHNKNNEQFNLFETIRIFENHAHKKKLWKNQIQDGRLKNLTETLKLNKEEFKSLKTYRDKHIAHTDSIIISNKYERPKICLDDLWNYLDIITDVYRELRWYFSGEQQEAPICKTNTFSYLTDNTIYELQALYKYRKMKDLMYTEKKKDPLNTLLNKFLTVVRGQK